MEFNEMSYWDKRKKLYDTYNEDMDIFVHTSFIANEILKLMDKPLFNKLNMFDCVIDLLVSGYFVCTVEGDQQIDPCNLVLNVDNNKVVWEKWEWKDIVETYNFNEIYYFSYDSEKYISLVHRMLGGDFDIEDDFLLGDVINKTIDTFSNYQFNINKVIKKENDIVNRIFKLNKLNGN